MQDQWYGDNRDLVKWGTLLELAHRYQAKHILQVLYYRPNEWKQILVDGEKVDIAEEVIQHFRNVNSICNLTAKTKQEKLPRITHKCLCGCGRETSGLYAPGHDAKVKGILLKIERGNLEKSDCPNTVAPFVKWSGQWKSKGFKLAAAPVRIPGRGEVENTSEKALSGTVSIEVLKEEFADRGDYLDSILAAIKAGNNRKGIVFLDPDIGLAPPGGRPSLEHVLEDELKTIWKSLSPGDVFVFYQHQPRIDDWIKTKMDQFASAIEIKSGNVKTAYAKGIAPDVVFFFAQRE